MDPEDFDTQDEGWRDRLDDIEAAMNWPEDDRGALESAGF